MLKKMRETHYVIFAVICFAMENEGLIDVPAGISPEQFSYGKALI
jgi:hypothetical protein